LNGVVTLGGLVDAYTKKVAGDQSGKQADAGKKENSCVSRLFEPEMLTAPDRGGFFAVGEQVNARLIT
jgi:hypothetical protein